MNILEKLNALPKPKGAEPVANYRDQLLYGLGVHPMDNRDEAQYQELMLTLTRLKSWLEENLGATEGATKMNSEFLQGMMRVTIDNIILVSAKRVALALESRPADANHDTQDTPQDSFETLLEALKFVSVPLAGLILPPGKNTILSGDGQSESENSERIEIKFQPRLAQFIALLKKNNITSDDIIVCHGASPEGMVRRVSYYIVEIPRLNKQVLLCDQIGEATFVIQGNLSRELLMTLTKEQLQEKYFKQVTRVVYTSSEAWEQQLVELLCTGNIGEKIDVRDQEALRAEFMKVIPTAEEWAGMVHTEKQVLKVTGLGLKAIATRFGVPRYNRGLRKDQLELGRKIYGECDVLREFTLDELRVEIKKMVPTVEAWVLRNGKERSGFNVAGMGLVGLATKFGSTGNPYTSPGYSSLGKQIYQISETLEEIYLKELKRLILLKVPTAAQWVAMDSDEKSAFKVNRLGLNALARKFGTNGNPIDLHKYHKELGLKIYGECDELKAFTKDELKNAVKKLIPTAAAWERMGQKEKKDFRLPGIGSTVSIAKELGITGNPIDHRHIHLELGRDIYGTCEELEDMTLDKLSAKILAKISTSLAWEQMSSTDRLSFKIGEMGLRTIGTRFGMTKNAAKNRETFLELRRRVENYQPAIEETSKQPE